MQEFEWHARKAAKNLEKHGIDFKDAVRIFEGTVQRVRSDRGSERRWKAIGRLREQVIAVIYTVRGERYRIISARMARRSEREGYREVLGEES